LLYVWKQRGHSSLMLMDGYFEFVLFISWLGPLENSGTSNSFELNYTGWVMVIVRRGWGLTFSKSEFPVLFSYIHHVSQTVSQPFPWDGLNRVFFNLKNSLTCFLTFWASFLGIYRYGWKILKKISGALLDRITNCVNFKNIHWNHHKLKNNEIAKSWNFKWPKNPFLTWYEKSAYEGLFYGSLTTRIDANRSEDRNFFCFLTVCCIW